MKTWLQFGLVFLVVSRGVAAEPSREREKQVQELVRQYHDDDAMLPSCRHYVRTETKGKQVREEVWERETGEVVKVAREEKETNGRRLEEFSFSQGGDLYFFFWRKGEAQADGGTRVTEVRTYLGDGETLIAKRSRSGSFPAGVRPEIPPKMASQEVDLRKDSDAERGGERWRNSAAAIVARVCEAKWLVFDPAKDAPAEWARVKLVQRTLSPDGRYVLAISPRARNFRWSEFAEKEPEENGGQTIFTLDRDKEEEILNWIADLKTHTLAGRTLGHHFGTKPSYNHWNVSMAWSPDSHWFIETTSAKWWATSCCAGVIRNGKVADVLDLGAELEKGTRAHLQEIGNGVYRRNAKRMAAQYSDSEIGNGGVGATTVHMQVPKGEFATVRVRFRIEDGKENLRVAVLGMKVEE